MTTEFPDIASLFTQIEVNADDFDFTETIGVIADDLAETHEEYFDDQSDPMGNPWKELSPVTVKKKGHPVILIETNRMRSSVVNRRNANHVEEITTDALTFGTDDEKATFHQEGTDRIPQRQFMGWNEPAIDSAVDKIADAAVIQLLNGL